jgi:hypothetical protein
MGKPWKTMGKSPFSKGKSTISMTIFNSYDWHNQRIFQPWYPSHPVR